MRGIIQKHWKKFSGFSLVGVGVTLFSFLLLYALNEVFHCNPYISYLVSYILSILLSYVLNAKIIYKTSLRKTDLLKYWAIYLLSMLLGTGVLWGYICLMPQFNETILSVMVLPITMLWNYYFVNKVSSPLKNEYAG